MNLSHILDATRLESEQRRSKTTLDSLKHQIRDMGPALGFARSLSARPFSIIAEIKIKSPSMGRMSPEAEKTAAVAHLVYQDHPVVSAISVLTQATHFGGSEARLRAVRRETKKPILRKDFIWDEYEVYCSRAMGADAILLMANVVSDKNRFADLHSLAGQLGMDVLCEVHSGEELDILPASARICGINSRNFKSSRRFLLAKVVRFLGRDASTDMSAFGLFDQVARRLSPSCLKVAESGITAQNLPEVLKRHPFNAALIGTSLLKGGPEYAKEELDRLQSAAASALSRPTSSAVPSAMPTRGS